MSGATPTLTYLKLSYILTQLLYARTESPLKGLLLFRKAWNIPVLFSICFYQTHTNITNDCVSITTTLVMGVKLMTDKYKKIHTLKVTVSAKISKCHKNIYFPAQQSLQNTLHRHLY